MHKDSGFSTRLIHSGKIDEPYKSATVPIYQTSTFSFSDADEGARCFAGESSGYIYTRIGNPTIHSLEELVTSLEGGYRSIAVSSGMAAVNTVYMALLNSGDHLISTGAVYGPARGVMENHWARFGVESSYIDTTRTENILKAIQPNTRVLYLETPANPTMDIADLRECAKMAKEHNLILVVDNTFATPYLQRPLEMGADVVLHSMTKFLNGHADIVAGIITTAEKTLYDKLRTVMVNMGCNMDPHQAYMVIRGLKTLSLRVEKAQANAGKVADFLEQHPKVAWIKYPGLESHPQHELVKKQMQGFGTMISFGLHGGFDAAKRLLNNVEMILLAVSLGGVESLIQHPASMTHSKVGKEAKLKAGITDDLVRLAIGIEDLEDILHDLDQALQKV